MSDAEIQEALGNAQADEAGITAAMELLETQAQLRDIEKMEFSSWVLEMERIGSPESLLAVENANRAAQGLPPLSQPTMAAPVVEPIEDVVSRLNELYANQGVDAEPALAEPVVEETSIQEPAIAPFFQDEPAYEEVAVSSEPVFEVIEVIEEVAEPIFEPVSEVAAEQSDSDLNEFERLLAADTVVGAEDELTALEQELEELPASVPLTIIEADPGVEFPSVSAVEQVSLDSAPKVNRGSNAFSQFWAWLGLSGSVLPLGLAWYVHSKGIAFSQAVLAIFLGALASAIVIAVGALAGKRSGLATLMLSRAAFGVYANAAPAAFLTIVRVLWSAAIVAVLINFGTEYFAVESLTSFSSSSTLTLIGVAVAVVSAAVTLAIFGGRVLFRAQRVVGLVGVAAVITLVALSASEIDIDLLLAQSTSAWPPVFGVAVLTFSIFGLAWTSSGADFARKLSISARGAAVVGWGALALAVIPTLVAGYGIALLGSIPKPEQSGLSSPGFHSVSMLQQFSELLTPWLGYVLAGSAALTIIVVLAMSFYSSNLSLHSIGVKMKPALAQPLLGLKALAVAAVGVYFLTNLWELLAGYALVVAVPVAAWSGIFVSDILIRRIAYHEISLSRGYGFYKAVNWVNLSGWLVATALGFGLTYSQVPGFGWTGYLADLMVNQEFWSATSLGIIIAFAFASLVPVLTGIPRIKKQEAEVLAIEARRDDLKDIFGLAD